MVTGKPYQRCRWELQSPWESHGHIHYILLVLSGPAHSQKERVIQGHQHQEAWAIGAGVASLKTVHHGGLPVAGEGLAGDKAKGSQHRTAQLFLLA